MNLISCSNCGVVIDRDRIPEQEAYEPDGSRKNVIWVDYEFVEAIDCPCCNYHLKI
jgi:hypothetical protein